MCVVHRILVPSQTFLLQPYLLVFSDTANHSHSKALPVESLSLYNVLIVAFSILKVLTRINLVEVASGFGFMTILQLDFGLKFLIIAYPVSASDHFKNVLDQGEFEFVIERRVST